MSRPGTSGSLGSDSGPVADTTTSALRLPLLVSISQRSRSPSHTIRFTRVEADVGRSPKAVGDVLQVGADVPLPGEGAGQSGLGAKENEYRWGRHVARAPGKLLSRQVPPTLLARSRTTIVGDALAPQPHGGPESAESRPDHRHSYVFVPLFVLVPAIPKPPRIAQNSASEHWRNGRVEQPVLMVGADKEVTPYA
ncbi:hypothetical protein GCM10023238_15200 [Streptomyces heliomycini]